MAHPSPGLFLTVVAVSLVMGTFGFAQNDAVSPSPSQKPGPSDHGLLLILSQDATPEPSDSSELRTCLARHLPLACVLLTITIKNDGAETVLAWWSTCGDTGMAFDLQKSDGSWEPFPPAPLSDRDIPLCSRNFTYVQKASPGESHVEQIRLADVFLYLDTALPPLDDGLIHPRHPGSAFLMAAGPHTIRLRWHVVGCIASGKLKPGDVPNAFTAQSLCVAGTEVNPRFVALQSNELNLSVRP